jgi:AhpD family alkylhydroperoxidase
MTTTEQRVNFLEKGQDALKALFGLGAYINKSTIEKPLRELVNFRVSQINGCAFCVDMHAKDARSMGETEQRLFGLSCWRETPYYNERERAALAWAEAVNDCHVTEEIYSSVKPYFSEQELIDLTLSVSTTNTWNRLNISFATTPGTYQVGQFG